MMIGFKIFILFGLILYGLFVFDPEAIQDKCIEECGKQGKLAITTSPSGGCICQYRNETISYKCKEKARELNMTLEWMGFYGCIFSDNNTKSLGDPYCQDEKSAVGEFTGYEYLWNGTLRNTTFTKIVEICVNFQTHEEGECVNGSCQF